MAAKPTEPTGEVVQKKPRRKLDKEEKLQIIQEFNEGKKSILTLASQSGVSQHTINKILRNKDNKTEAAKGLYP